VTPPSSRDPERVPVGRLALWGVLVAVILLGIYLYLRYQRSMTPLISDRGPRTTQSTHRLNS
jgi:hypothetical protein